MTLKQFIRQIPSNCWLINHFKGSLIYSIRTKDLFSCPLTASEGEFSAYWPECSDKFGLPRYIGQYITYASDYKYPPFGIETDPSNLIELRKILLKACGLEEQS